MRRSTGNLCQRLAAKIRLAPSPAMLATLPRHWSQYFILLQTTLAPSSVQLSARSVSPSGVPKNESSAATSTGAPADRSRDGETGAGKQQFQVGAGMVRQLRASSSASGVGRSAGHLQRLVASASSASVAGSRVSTAPAISGPGPFASQELGWGHCRRNLLLADLAEAPVVDEGITEARQPAELFAVEEQKHQEPPAGAGQFTLRWEDVDPLLLLCSVTTGCSQLTTNQLR